MGEDNFLKRALEAGNALDTVKSRQITGQHEESDISDQQEKEDLQQTGRSRSWTMEDEDLLDPDFEIEEGYYEMDWLDETAKAQLVAQIEKTKNDFLLAEVKILLGIDSGNRQDEAAAVQEA